MALPEKGPKVTLRLPPLISTPD